MTEIAKGYEIPYFDVTSLIQISFSEMIFSAFIQLLPKTVL
jgi:hypothetical protein